MDSNPLCPVCCSNSWDIIGSKIYSKSDVSQLSAYAKVRYDVLFNVWLPDTEAEFSSILCNKCGFVAYTPRPTSTDLENKYRFLAHHPDSSKESSVELVSDKIRSVELFSYLSKYLEKQHAEILDYGGGNGRLMTSFLDNEYCCNIVDYIEKTLPNIKRLGAVVADIPKNSRFDMIICSHVLEHLVDPTEVVRSLADYLLDDGIIYVEVPLEIWDCIPLPVEPVTHINFFSPESLRILLEVSGLEVITCEQDLFTTEDGQKAFAVKAVARRPKVSLPLETTFKNFKNETKQLIFPTLGMKILRSIKYSIVREKLFKSWVQDHLPKTFFWRFYP